MIATCNWNESWGLSNIFSAFLKDLQTTLLYSTQLFRLTHSAATNGSYLVDALALYIEIKIIIIFGS